MACLRTTFKDFFLSMWAYDGLLKAGLTVKKEKQQQQRKHNEMKQQQTRKEKNRKQINKSQHNVPERAKLCSADTDLTNWFFKFGFQLTFLCQSHFWPVKIDPIHWLVSWVRVFITMRGLFPIHIPLLYVVTSTVVESFWALTGKLLKTMLQNCVQGLRKNFNVLMFLAEYLCVVLRLQMTFFVHSALNLAAVKW